jgi:catechol 2,3-dioxygenase-like lactoylglutathione lyase family enzyme
MKLEFHHINFVSKNIDNMNEFYINILEMDSIPIEKFPRTEETVDSGYSGKINFVTEGKIEMHLAERDINVAFKNNHTINPVDKGHIAFRTDDINSFINKLKKRKHSVFRLWNYFCQRMASSFFS